MQTKAEVLAALDGALPERMNLGVVGQSIVLVMNMETKAGAQCGLVVVGEAVNTAIEAASLLLTEFEQSLSAEARH